MILITLWKVGRIILHFLKINWQIIFSVNVLNPLNEYEAISLNFDTVEIFNIGFLIHLYKENQGFERSIKKIRIYGFTSDLTRYF